jgi:hypothetical protein
MMSLKHSIDASWCSAGDDRAISRDKLWSVPDVGPVAELHAIRLLRSGGAAAIELFPNVRAARLIEAAP